MRFLALAFTLFASCSYLSAQRSISVGVVGGVPFTGSFADRSFTPTPILPYVGSVYGVHAYSGSNNYAVGPEAEFRFPLNFSLEVDALYRPLSLVEQEYVIGPGPESPSKKNYSSWEFPVLAKYRDSRPFIKPFVEAGPNFRTLPNPVNKSLSKLGISGGVGIEAKIWILSIAPQLRVTHWGKDLGGAALNYVASERNEGEFLLTFSF